MARRVSFLEESTAVKGKEKEADIEEKERFGGSKLVWDCDSCLYDSFELMCFKRQLDSAISSSSSCRSKSMPHFASSQPPTSAPSPLKKNPRHKKALRPFSKLLQLIFRTRPTTALGRGGGGDKRALTMRQDAHPRPQKGALHFIPETDSGVRKTVSERFRFNTALGVSFA